MESMENQNYPLPPESIQPVIPPAGNPRNKILIAVVAVLAAVLLLALGVLAGYLIYQSQPNVPGDNLPDNQSQTLPTSTEPTSNPTANTLITWNQPQPIASLGIFHNAADFPQGMVAFDPEKDAKYYKVGIINDGQYKGGEVILVNASVNAPGWSFGFYRFIKTESGLVLLKKYSDGTEAESGLNKAKFTVDENFDIPQLNFPKTIVGPAPHETLEIYPYINALFSLNSLKKVFTDSALGDVYTSSVYDSTNVDLFARNGFYIQAPDGTVRIYTLKIDFIAENRGPLITWSDGTENKISYDYTEHTGCGSANFASVIPGSMVSDTDLKIAGKTSTGDNVYELKDSNHYLLKDFYDNKYQVMADQKKISYQAFIASHPMFFWRDPFGRLIKFANAAYAPLAECGKPVIYLYPVSAQAVSVKVEPQGGMTYSDPAYGSGWNVWATPSGDLTQLSSGRKYLYLFWEGRGGMYEQPKKGFVVKQSEVHHFLVAKLALLGLNKKETADFIEFWEPRMQGSPYYFVTFLGKTQMDQLAPLTISPRPDTVIRILMDFSPLSQPTEVEGYGITTPARKGFTVVEWGGVLR